MASILPFAAVRPPRSKAGLVSTRSYMSYTPGQLREKQDTNPFSFLHVIHPLLADSLKGEKYYAAVRSAYESFLAKGYLKQEAEEGLWIYEQTTHEGHRVKGLLGLISLKDVASGEVKPHEKTLSKREDLFSKYLKAVGFQTEPVLLSHVDRNDLRQWLDQHSAGRPEAEFATADGSEHSLWVVTHGAEIAKVQDIVSTLHSLYIADGHHRCASSLHLQNEIPGILAFLVPDSQLVVRPFHRVVTGNPPNEAAWERVKEFAQVEKVTRLPDPLPRGSMGIYHQKSWWKVTPFIQPFLDVSWCSDHLLASLWDVKDLRTDKRISFQAGTESVERIAEKCTKDQWLVVLAPTLWSSVETIADRKESMPPKSTYIEPKLRSGLTLFSWK